MLSEEGEKLSLKTTFNPKAAGGNVEKWFIEAEAAMRETVKDITRKSFDAHAVSKRIDWVLQWPGQVREASARLVLIECIGQAHQKYVLFAVCALGQWVV